MTINQLLRNFGLHQALFSKRPLVWRRGKSAVTRQLKLLIRVESGFPQFPRAIQTDQPEQLELITYCSLY